MEKYKSRKELASELSISTRTLERKLKKVSYQLKKGVLSPTEQLRIKTLLE